MAILKISTQVVAPKGTGERKTGELLRVGVAGYCGGTATI